MRQVTLTAPSKVILAGEHAVVHGGSALAMAVDRRVQVAVGMGERPGVTFDLPDIGYHGHATFESLAELRARLDARRQAFLTAGTAGSIVEHPWQLLHYTMGYLMDACQWPRHLACRIQLASDVPMRSGMGSSAASVVGLMAAMLAALRWPVARAKRLAWARDCESVQHGHSSGIDVWLSWRGGCYRYASGQVKARAFPRVPMTFVHTGQPLSATQACIAVARPRFHRNPNLVSHFEASVDALDRALWQGDLPGVLAAVRTNHRLLVDLGVVPDAVQRFVARCEAQGLAAKICGAGTVAGDGAGLVWVVGSGEVPLEGGSPWALQPCTLGVRC